MKGSKLRIVLATVAALMVAASVLSTHRVMHTVSWAELLWRSDEAFLLIGTKQLGWHQSYLKLAANLLVPLPATDSRHSIAVFRITDRGIERHVADDITMATFGVLDQQIVSSRWRWNGRTFEAVTADHSERWRTPPQEFSNVNGWSKRSFLPATTPSGGVTIAFDIAGQPAALKVISTVLEWSAIDLERKNQASEPLWSLEQRPRWFVGRSEYDAIFKR